MAIYQRGADPEALDGCARSLGAYAGRCGGVRADAAQAMVTVAAGWGGSDASRLKGEWATHEAALTGLERTLHMLADRLRTNAAAQRSASHPGVGLSTAKPAADGLVPRWARTAVTSPGSTTLDRLVDAGVLPPDARGMRARDLSIFLRGSPDVASALMRHKPIGTDPSDPAAAFLAALEVPVITDGATDTEAQRRQSVRAWFAAMDAEDQRLVATLYPAQVGNLSGAPFAARSAANQIAVIAARCETASRMAAAQSELAGITSWRDGKYAWQPGGPLDLPANLREDAVRDRIEQLRSEHDFYTVITDAIGTAHQRQIVVFDAAGSRYAEVSGALDGHTANVGVLIPGTYSSLRNIDESVRISMDFVNNTPSGKLTMVTYLGGPMPQRLVTESPRPDFALDAAPGLAAFSRDLRQETTDSAAGPDRPDLAYGGYSYGGAVVGCAEEYGLDADRVLHIESAGICHDVFEPGQLHPATPDVRRYSMTAPGDPIGLTQGVQVGGLGHGADPDNFAGVTRLDTGTWPDGSPMVGVSAHTGVFTPGSTPWDSMRAVFAGGPATQRLDDPSRDFPWLRPELRQVTIP